MASLSRFVALTAAVSLGVALAPPPSAAQTALPPLKIGLIMSFTFSFDDLIVSEMLATPTVSTLPVYIFGETHSGVTPNVYAIATVMLVITLIGFSLVGLVYKIFGRTAGADTSLTSAVAGSHG